MVTLVTVPADYLAILTHNGWFSRQTAGLQRRLVEAGRLVVLRRGQWVYSQGDEGTGLCAILSGAVRLEVAVSAERDVLIGLVGPPGVLGQTRRRGGGPRIVTMRANMPSRVLTIADAALEAVAADEPGLWRAVNELVHAQLEETTRLAARLLVQGPAARIAARLLQFSQDDRVTVSQSDLAEMTGLSRKSVNGHLAAFARAGTIARGYRAITIVDRGALEDVAMR